MKRSNDHWWVLHLALPLAAAATLLAVAFFGSRSSDLEEEAIEAQAPVAAAPPPDAGVRFEERAAVVREERHAEPKLERERATIEQLALDVASLDRAEPAAPRDGAPIDRVVLIARDEPREIRSAPEKIKPEPRAEALSPAEFALRQALTRLEGCASMPECLSLAKAALALFGADDDISIPTRVSIEQFREAQVIYRRGQADVLHIAKRIAATPAGRKKEPELRQIFELLPHNDEWLLSPGELEPIRRALDRSVRVWLRDNHLEPTRSISLAVGILTPTRKNAIEASVTVQNDNDVIGDPNRLREFAIREIQALPEVKIAQRQRLARFKLVINPGTSYALD